MKIKLLVCAVAILGMVACEDLGTVDIDTTFSKTIVADVYEASPTASAFLKSASDSGYSFYESDTIDLTENNDIQEYIENINELDIYQVTCKLNGIPEGDTISYLTIASTNVGFSASLYDLTENDSIYDIAISAGFLKSLGEELLTNEKLEVNISGISTYAPMTLSISLYLKTIVKANVLTSTTEE